MVPNKLVPPTGFEPVMCSHLELITGISRAFYQLNYRGKTSGFICLDHSPPNGLWQ